MKKPYPIHPLCELLPAMSPAEYAGLRESIRTHRQTDDVILLDGKVIDGRHRQAVCQELGIECRYTDFKKAWGDPVEWVMARAIHRHLTQGQKAAAAAGLADAMVAAGVERSKANLRRGKDAPPEKAETQAEIGRSVDRVASLFGVSPRYVTDARFVRQQNPKLFAQVFAGGVKLSVAKAEVRREHKRQMIGKRLSGPLPNAGMWDLMPVNCVEAMARLPRKCAKLVFADPPYNQGVDYGKGKKADLMPRADYLRFAADWMAEAAELLTPDGSLWLLISHEYAADYELIARDVGLTVRAWITWFESFGVNCSDNFNRTSRRLLYCVRNPGRFVFDRSVFNRPSDRQAKYNDQRASPGGKVWDDVWGINPPIPRLVGNDSERIPDFPTQLSLKLLNPIIAGVTEPGDLVIDPFNGSGTTGVAACEQGRNYIGMDVSVKFISLAGKRLARHGKESLSFWVAE